MRKKIFLSGLVVVLVLSPSFVIGESGISEDTAIELFPGWWESGSISPDRPLMYFRMDTKAGNWYMIEFQVQFSYMHIDVYYRDSDSYDLIAAPTAIAHNLFRQEIINFDFIFIEVSWNPVYDALDKERKFNIRVYDSTTSGIFSQKNVYYHLWGGIFLGVVIIGIVGYWKLKKGKLSI